MALSDDAADRLARAQAALVQLLARAAFAKMWRALGEDSALSPRDAIQAAQADFGGAFARALAGAFSELLQRSVGVAEVRAMPVGDIALSQRLHRHDAQTLAEVLQAIKAHAQGVHQARELALALYDGYSPAQGPKRPLEGRSRADLPRYLRELTNDPEARLSLARVIEQGQAQASRLKSAPLRAAYAEALGAWEAGAGREALKRRLEIAQREKNRFFANRIAQTELARAHQADVAAELMADESIDVVQVRINPAHPRTDICFRAGTPIQTAMGEVPIENVAVGDLALTHLGEWRPVVKLYRSHVAPGGRLLSVVVRAISGGCHLATMTPNHPVRVPGGWTLAADLRTGSLVEVCLESTHCRQSCDGACGTAPSSSAESSTGMGLRSAVWQRCGEPQETASPHTARTCAQCAPSPTGERSSAIRTCLDHQRRLSSSDYLGPSCQSKVTIGIPASAETCQGAWRRNSDSFRLTSHSDLSSTSSHGRQEQSVFHTPCTVESGILQSSTSEPGNTSRTPCCSDGMCSESCRRSYIGTGVVVSADDVESEGEDVFNLEVYEHHSYVAGGIVVHNCDMHARADLFGLGPGNYPKAKAPRPPFHPFCWCRLRSRPSLSAAGARPMPGAEAAYLRSMPADEAARVMGSRQRLQRVLDGASVDSVVNAGVDPLYRLARLGDPGAGHALVENAGMAVDAVTFGSWARQVAGPMYLAKHEFVAVASLPKFVLSDTDVARLRPIGSTVYISDFQLRHSLRPSKAARNAALPIEVAADLPARLAAARWAFDKTHDGVIAFFDAGVPGRIGKAVVHFNHVRRGHKYNAVLTTGLVNPENESEREYRSLKKPKA